LEQDGWKGFVFSSLRASDCMQDEEEEFTGEPSVSTSSNIFRKGKSGLPKVAHLAASVAGAQVIVRVVKRRRGFHVFVPFVVSQQNA